jgi:predicted TIM-barrel fold metal-dependent hydrolase
MRATAVPKIYASAKQECLINRVENTGFLKWEPCGAQLAKDRHMTRARLPGWAVAVACSLLILVSSVLYKGAKAAPATYEFNDSHFHLTNYIQEGTPIQEFLKIMGTTTGRVALFGIPLQQEWSARVSGDRAPTYYLQSDAPLYYYSFTDAQIALAWLSLSKEERARFDPLITGFNPADMYAADHIRRVLKTFPGVFRGIGEFTVHKEFVSSKVAGGVPSLLDPALDRILDLAEEVGLLVLMHNDVDVPFPKPNDPPVYLDDMKAVLRRHPHTTIIWAHTGVGRVVRPINHHADMVAAILRDPEFAHVMFDISWDEVAKYMVASPESLKISADLLNAFPDRFLFGTDSVAPKNRDDYLKTYRDYDPLWPLLTPETRLKIRKTNYDRVFDEASRRVRAWESTQLPATAQRVPGQ